MTDGRQMMQEVLPIHDIGVRIQVPQGRSVKRVYLAPDERDLPFSIDDGCVVATVPQVFVHSMLIVDLD
jgi:hypothetical protein